jgi:UDP-2,3-diacylglucosamine hydrolase
VPRKLYFASDFHLGLRAGTDPLVREKRVVKWLDEISQNAEEIYLLGDVFDFWWEYKKVVPKGFTRFLGKTAELTDSGIPVHFFTGNHDMWIGTYLKDECGMIIHTGPCIITKDNKKLYLAHGEGLGSSETGYKMLLAAFRNKTIRSIYSALHPSIGIWIGHTWSLSSRLNKGIHLEFLGEEKEDLFIHSKKVLENDQIDFFIYGHRHLPMTYRLKEGAQITILGDWIERGSYAEWDGSVLSLKFTV